MCHSVCRYLTTHKTTSVVVLKWLHCTGLPLRRKRSSGGIISLLFPWVPRSKTWPLGGRTMASHLSLRHVWEKHLTSKVPLELAEAFVPTEALLDCSLILLLALIHRYWSKSHFHITFLHSNLHFSIFAFGLLICEKYFCESNRYLNDLKKSQVKNVNCS